MTDQPKITAESIRQAKKQGAKIPMLTCYDYPMARLLDEIGIPVLLVGDSVGMVVLGFPNTTLVTMDHMIHHISAVARAKPRALIVGDLPYESYLTPETALANARKLVQAGAEAVKLEGGVAFEEQVRTITQAGIPLMGHIGMLPQSVLVEGRYNLKGKTEDSRNKLLADAQSLEAAGAFAIVMELVQADTAAHITQNIGIPTIGIGAGTGCDGQVLVTHDLIGSFPWFRPKFAQARGNVADEIKKAVLAYQADVKGTLT